MPMRHRTLRNIALAAFLAAACGIATAQEFAFEWNPRSGDAWVDERLGDINRYGDRYRESFIDELARYYGAPRELVNALIVDRRWAPGDVYYACAIAQVVGRPCAHVVDQWERGHGEGWGAVAQRLGIEPGSDQFHRLKRGFVPTYDRWQRPVTLDRDLVDDFPNRGKPPVKRRAIPANGKGVAPDKSSGKGQGQQGKSTKKGG